MIPDNQNATGLRPGLADIYAALGITDRDCVSLIADTLPGKAKTYVPPMACEVAPNLTGNVFFGLNPLDPQRIPPGSQGKRGNTEDVARIVGLPIDLDVKPGGCPDHSAAEAITADVSMVLETRPAVIIRSSDNGRQPIWAVEDCEPERGKVLLRRFGRLVRAIAKERKAKVDSVFDAARMLRVPGTLNPKYDPPQHVFADLDVGHPLDADTISERLDAWGIYETDADHGNTGERKIVAAEADWHWAVESCGYAVTAIRGWLTEPVPARHPWALKQRIRLESMRRYGCLSHAQYAAGVEVIEKRLACLLSSQEPKRPLGRYELANIADYAVSLAERKTDAELALEVGRHPHTMAGPVQPPTPKADRAAAGSTAPNVGTVTPLPGIVAPPAADAEPAPTADAELKLSDLGNARRLVETYGDRLRYVPELGRFAHWTGDHWHVEEGREHVHAGRLAGLIAESLEVLPDDKLAKAHRKRSLSRNGIDSMVKVASYQQELWTPQKMLDARLYELNTPSGIVDLRTGEVRNHDPDAWHTRITGVGYEPDLDCAMWKAFLDTTFEGSAELIGFMQRLAGYACIGEVTHHILPFLYGESGQNGKSVLLRVFQECLGTYAMVLPVSALVHGRKGHTEDTAKLPGARLAVCSEVGEGTRWDEEKIKSLTGGDIQTARPNFGHKFDYVPSHTIMLAANDQPGVDSGGKSFFRRLKLIPFNHSVPDEQVNERLPMELVEREGAAILAWMVRGSVDVIHNGLRPPALVETATADYQASEDDVGQWIEACCERVSKNFTQTSAVLYEAYAKWCRANGVTARNDKSFGKQLTRHGVATVKSHGTRVRAGLKLSDDPRGQASFWQP